MFALRPLTSYLPDNPNFVYYQNSSLLQLSQVFNYVSQEGNLVLGRGALPPACKKYKDFF
jgi:hypothetical protein